MTDIYILTDSYTGLHWCAKGLHLLDAVNRAPNGRCRPCAARNARQRRKERHT